MIAKNYTPKKKNYYKFGTNIKERNAIILEYAPLIRQIAYSLVMRLPPSVEVDDLYGAGVLGLIDAIGKFDPNKCDNFKNYAKIRIRGAMLDELRAIDWVPRSVRQKVTEVQRVTKRLEQEKGGPVTQSDIACEMNMQLSHYHILLDKIRSISVLGFEDLGINNHKEQRDFMQCLDDPDAVLPDQAALYREALEVMAQTIDRLPERQKLVVSLYYLEDMNLKEIGKVLGVTESRISQIHTQAILNLRVRMRRRFRRD